MWSSVAALLLRPRGDRRWDWFLRGTVAAALAGIGLALAVPQAIPLVWLAVLGIPANSPLSPVVPTAFEPLIIEAGKVAEPVAVSVVATGIYLYTEYLNWHLYRWALAGPRAERLRALAWVERGLRGFGRAPFASVVVFAFTPLPFWAVRGAAVLRGYPLARFLAATALGRWPRFALYGWLGSALRIPAVALVLVVLGGAAVVVTRRLVRGELVLQEPVLDVPEPEWGGAGPGAAPADCQPAVPRRAFRCSPGC